MVGPKFQIGDVVVFKKDKYFEEGKIINFNRDYHNHRWLYSIEGGSDTSGKHRYAFDVLEEDIMKGSLKEYLPNWDEYANQFKEISDKINNNLLKEYAKFDEVTLLDFNIDDVMVDKIKEERKMAEEKKLTIRGKVYRKDIKQVIFQAPATIILFEDGTKSVVKVNGDDMYNKQIGFLLALCKGCFDNKSYDVILRLIDDFNDQENKKEIKLKTYLNLPPKSSNYAGKINNISFKYDITFEDVRNVFKNKVPANKDNEVSIAKNAYHIGVAKRLCEMILESGDAHVATDICAAVEHLMVCLEERSHNLNYEKSFEFHNIKLLMERYHFDEKRPSETKSESKFNIDDIVIAKKGHGTKYRIIEKKRLPDDTWTYVARTLGVCGSKGHINRHFREDQLAED